MPDGPTEEREGAEGISDEELAALRDDIDADRFDYHGAATILGLLARSDELEGMNAKLAHTIHLMSARLDATSDALSVARRKLEREQAHIATLERHNKQVAKRDRRKNREAFDGFHALQAKLDYWRERCAESEAAHDAESDRHESTRAELARAREALRLMEPLEKAARFLYERSKQEHTMNQFGRAGHGCNHCPECVLRAPLAAYDLALTTPSAEAPENG